MKRIQRNLTGLIILLGCLVPTHCQADVTVDKKDNDRGTLHVYKISVTPAKEASPAFEHRFTVMPHETIAGNSITHYLRSLGEGGVSRPSRHFEKEFGFEFYEWANLDFPSEDIPMEKLRKFSDTFDFYVKHHIQRATICRDADWGLTLEELRGREVVEFLLPSVQETRQIARVLILRTRLAVLENRYDDAIDHIRMIHQLAQSVNEQGLLVSNLVAIAEVNMANEQTLGLIGAKDSPNLYWTLAELPQPIISIRNALRLESSFGVRYLPELMDVESADHSKERWGQMLRDMIAALNSVHEYMGYPEEEKNEKASDMSALFGLAGYGRAKDRLIAGGMDKAKVEEMCVAQVLIIDAARDYERYMSEVEKSFYVPMDRLRKADREVNDLIRANGKTRLGALIVDLLSPAIQQVREAEVRPQTQINMLMAVESIRHHIATKGELPKSLDELELTVRPNPYTGKAFGYELDGDTATISFNRSPYCWHYEITIAK